MSWRRSNSWNQRHHSMGSRSSPGLAESSPPRRIRSGEPRTSAGPTLLLNPGAGALLIPDENIRLAVARDVPCHHLHPHAGVLVGLVADPFHRLIGVALELEPVHDGGGGGVDVALGAVGEVAF